MFNNLLYYKNDLMKFPHPSLLHGRIRRIGYSAFKDSPTGGISITFLGNADLSERSLSDAGRMDATRHRSRVVQPLYCMYVCVYVYNVSYFILDVRNISH